MSIKTFNSASQRLFTAAADAAKMAREIAEKADAENREMTSSERAEFDQKFKEAVGLRDQAKTKSADEKVVNDARLLADELGLFVADDSGTKSGVKASDGFVALEKQVVNSLEFKSFMKNFQSGHIPDGVRVHTGPISVKNLISGGSSSVGGFVAPEVSGIVDLLGRKPTTLRDLVVRRRTGSDAVTFVRQSLRDNGAAEVPEATSADSPTVTTTVDGETVTSTVVPAVGGGYKPQSGFAFEVVTANVKTIATWVPVTRKALADVAQLEGIIRDELTQNLLEREDLQLLNGDGSGENFTGILNTSGIQTQAFTTDVFASIRKAITKARTVGRVVPNAILISPEDLETVDLARESSGSSKFIGAGPFQAGQRTLWGLPLVENENLPAKTALVGDFTKAVVWDRDQASVNFSDSHEDFFVRNLVAALAEQREAFGVLRPAAFVRTATAA